MLTWTKERESSAVISPGGFSWCAHINGEFFGMVFNDGWSSVGCVPIRHGSIHLAALRVQREAEARKANR